MTSPYIPPTSNVLSDTTAPGNSGRRPRSMFAILASATAMVILCIVALMLIPQALNLASESASLPPRLQGGNAAMIRASWIGGLTALGGVLLNAVGLVLSFRGGKILPLSICGLSIACIIAIAIIFKPT